MQPRNRTNFKEVLGPQARPAGAIEDKRQLVQFLTERYSSSLHFQIACINTCTHKMNRTATENSPPGCKQASKLPRGWPTGGWSAPLPVERVASAGVHSSPALDPLGRAASTGPAQGVSQPHQPRRSPPTSALLPWPPAGPQQPTAAGREAQY